MCDGVAASTVRGGRFERRSPGILRVITGVYGRTASARTQRVVHVRAGRASVAVAVLPTRVPVAEYHPASGRYVRWDVVVLCCVMVDPLKVFWVLTNSTYLGKRLLLGYCNQAVHKQRNTLFILNIYFF